MCRSARQIDLGQQIVKQVTMRLLKETLSCGGTIRSGEIEIVDDGQGIQLAMTDAMQAMVSKCELAVAAFGAGTGALKELSTLGGHRFNQPFVSVFERGERGVRSVDAVEKGL